MWHAKQVESKLTRGYLSFFPAARILIESYLLNRGSRLCCFFGGDNVLGDNDLVSIFENAHDTVEISQVVPGCEFSSTTPGGISKSGNRPRLTSYRTEY